LKRGDTGQAIGLLERILEQGQPFPAVLLTLADICQYRLEDLPRAVSYLREYLALEDSRTSAPGCASWKRQPNS